MRATEPGYDYVIVGVGSAGSVLAGRVSEDPRLRASAPAAVERACPRRASLESEMSFGTGRYHSVDLSPHRRLDEWRRVIGDTLVPLEIDFDHGPEYPSHISTSCLGRVRIPDSRPGPGPSYRPRQSIRKSDPD